MRVGIALLSVALCLGAAPAGAQVITAPDTITKCLCAQELMDHLRTDVDAARQQYDTDKARLTALDAEIAGAKPRADVSNPEQVEAFRRLNISRDESFAKLNDTDQPHLVDVTTRFNRATDRFNSQCAGRNFDANIQAQLGAGLVCPIEEAPVLSPR